MPRREKHSKMDILNNIPKEFIKIIFRVSLILFFLNFISLIMTIMHNVNVVIAAISTVLSLIIAISCFLIIKKQAKQ